MKPKILRKKFWIRDIQKRTDELHSAGEASMEEIRMLNEERKLMEQDGIHNGSSLTTLETRYNEAKRICNVLSELSEDEWILNAPDKLWLTSLNVEKEGSYLGNGRHSRGSHRDLGHTDGGTDVLAV